MATDAENDESVVEKRKLDAEILLQDAQEAMQEKNLEGALDLLREATTLDPDRIELEGYVDMVRTKLLKSYRERIGDVESTPRLLCEIQSISNLELTAEAGFLLSLIDGATTVDQILSLSGMDAFDAFRILNRLVDAEIATVDS